MGLTIVLDAARTDTSPATFTVTRPADSGSFNVMVGMEMPLPAAAALLTSRGLTPGEAFTHLAAATEQGTVTIPA